MLLAFLIGYFFGVATLAVASDIRRALLSAQEREKAFERRAQGLEGISHV